jgi:hypothetical protein
MTSLSSVKERESCTQFVEVRKETGEEKLSCHSEKKRCNSIDEDALRENQMGEERQLQGKTKVMIRHGILKRKTIDSLWAAKVYSGGRMGRDALE